MIVLFKKIFSKIYIHALAIFFLSFLYTKGSLPQVLFRYIPPFATLMIFSFFLIFLLFIYWIKRNEPTIENSFQWKSVIKVLILGSLFGYILQLLNICIYLYIRHIKIDIGFFEDEFYRTVVFLLPCLFVAEIIYFYVKNSYKKQLAITFLILIWIGYQGFNLLYVKSVNYPSVKESSKTKPNFVVILADDLGIADLSINGQKKYTTPNIDKLGLEGINFKTAFVTAPICSPSRAGLLTGQYQQRVGFEFLTDLFSTHPYARKADFEKNGHEFGENYFWWELEMKNRGLEPSSTTLSEFLKEDGYATAAIGKWHLGAAPRFVPKNTGFDYSLGAYNAGMFYLPPKHKDLEESFIEDVFFERLEHQLMVYKFLENDKDYTPEKEIYTTDLFTNKGIEFIEKNKKNRFFLYLPYNAVHGPFQSPKEVYNSLSHIKDHRERVYAAMVKSLDNSVGKIINKLEKENLLENTIIVFSSDNGAPLYFKAGSNKPLYGGKMSGFEGGLRVPLFFYWKNHFKPTEYNEQVSLMDIFKTFAGIIKKEVPENIAIDGVNLLPFILSEEQKSKPHKVLIWRIGYINIVRKGDWKLNFNKKENLYFLHNLKEDPSEKFNLFKANPQKVKELKDEFSNWEKKMKNPNWVNIVDAKIEDGLGNRFFFPW